MVFSRDLDPSVPMSVPRDVVEAAVLRIFRLKPNDFELARCREEAASYAGEEFRRRFDEEIGELDFMTSFLERGNWTPMPFPLLLAAYADAAALCVELGRYSFALSIYPTVGSFVGRIPIPEYRASGHRFLAAIAMIALDYELAEQHLDRAAPNRGGSSAAHDLLLAALYSHKGDWDQAAEMAVASFLQLRSSGWSGFDEAIELLHRLLPPRRRG